MSFVQNGKKIVAIGRNYVNHVKELNNKIPTEPFFFLKPTTSYVPTGGIVEIPSGIKVSHEVELGVVIGQRGRDITDDNWQDYISGYALAIDMTARNLQEKVKKQGLPWSAVKGFDTFCPISQYIPASAIKDPHNVELYLQINGQDRQRDYTSQMIFNIPELLKHVSSIMTLEEGDLLLTGTPSGVGPVVDGDLIKAGLVQAGQELASWEGVAKNRVGGYQFVEA